MKAEMSFKDKLIDYRNRYRRLKSKGAKGRFITHLAETFGFERKYLIKLLNGQREYKPPRGRGRTYGKEEERMALKLRRLVADPCAPYFVAMLPRIVSDWEALKGPLDSEVRGKLLSVSTSTVARWFRKHPSKRIRHGNRCSGDNGVRKAVPCCPGLAIEDGAPGVAQVDTVAHGGGGPEPFFYSIDITDATTQWTEFDFMWCRSGEAVKNAIGPMLRRFPFRIRKVHPDGGGEFMNGAVLALFAENFPEVEVFRSRPSRPNDNCRVEQKNGSILRAWLGEARIDDQSLEPSLHELARCLSLYHNFFVPCKKLLSKTPRDKLHTSYKMVYDDPKPPFERCKKSGLCNASRIAELEKLRGKINVFHLVAKIKSLVKAVVDNTNKARGAAGLAPQHLASKPGV